jgi:alpha-D-ribose 1-methylphosphonate 5-triphosphate diphosphatase PhnM
MTLEEYRARNKEERETNKKEIDEYIKMVNDANQRNRSNTVNPIVDNYYSRRNFTDLLAD